MAKPKSETKLEKKERKPPKEKTPDEKLLKLVRFTPMLIHRSRISFAEYNPRFIRNTNRKELNGILHTFGMVVKPVWNERTGILVSGHRRLELRDEAEGSLDYELWVNRIDVDSDKEMRLNLVLNNPNVQGTYDVKALSGLLLETGAEGTGFTPHNISTFVDPVAIGAIFGTHQNSPIQATPPPAAIIAAPLQAVSGQVNESQVVLVFQSRNGADRFAEQFGFDLESRYLDGTRLLELVERGIA